MSEPIIKINDVNKWFGDFQVLKNINLDVNAKQKIVVINKDFLYFIFTRFDLGKALYDHFLGLQKTLWWYFFQQSYLRP